MNTLPRSVGRGACAGLCLLLVCLTNTHAEEAAAPSLPATAETRLSPAGNTSSNQPPLPTGGEVAVTTLNGGTQRGTIVEMTAEVLTLAQSQKKATIPRSQLLRVQYPFASTAPSFVEVPIGEAVPPSAPLIRVLTRDGSLLLCQQFVTDGHEARLRLRDDSVLTIPLPELAAVLLRIASPLDSEQWRQTAGQARGSDRLVAQRGDKRVELDGIIGTVGSETLTFTLDGEELPVKRERVVALFYAHGAVAEVPALGELLDRQGNRWSIAKLEGTGAAWSLTTPWGARRELPASMVLALDFARGRLTYLSDLEPVIVQQLPQFDVVWEYRKDQNLSGGPIRCGGVEFAKGLTLHSRTVLEYELKGKYRTLKALVGIEDSAGPWGNALVRLKVDGQNREEWEARAGQPPKPIALHLNGAQRLTIEVDFGKSFDLGDHVVLGDARLLRE